MKVMQQFTHDAINIPEVLASVQSPVAGAVMLFLGTTRNQTDVLVQTLAKLGEVTAQAAQAPKGDRK